MSTLTEAFQHLGGQVLSFLKYEKMNIILVRTYNDLDKKVSMRRIDWNTTNKILSVILHNENISCPESWTHPIKRSYFKPIVGREEVVSPCI